jgi:hypothetical protein
MQNLQLATGSGFAQILNQALRPGRLAPDPDRPAPRRVTPLAALLYSTMSSYAYGNKDTCFPSLRTLAGDLGVSTRTITRKIRELRDALWIEVQHRFAECRTNIYKLLWRSSLPAQPLDTMSTPPSQDVESLSTPVANEEDNGKITNEEGDGPQPDLIAGSEKIAARRLQEALSLSGLCAMGNAGVRAVALAAGGGICLKVASWIEPEFMRNRPALKDGFAAVGITEVWIIN